MKMNKIKQYKSKDWYEKRLEKINRALNPESLKPRSKPGVKKRKCKSCRVEISSRGRDVCKECRLKAFKEANPIAPEPSKVGTLPPKPKYKRVANSKGRYYTFKGKSPEKNLYWSMVWDLTEQNDLTVLPNHHKRGFKNYHLDHKVSIGFGFQHGILPRHIADISNLRFIPWRENYKKGVDCVETELFTSASQGLL